MVEDPGQVNPLKIKTDTFRLILAFVDFRSLLRLNRVGRFFNAQSNNELLWKNLFRKHFPRHPFDEQKSAKQQFMKIIRDRLDKMSAPKKLTEAKAFVRCVAFGTVSEVEKMLLNNPNLLNIFENGYGPLHWACVTGNDEVLLHLLDEFNKQGSLQFMLNLSNDNSRRLVYIATEFCHFSTVKLLWSYAGVKATDCLALALENECVPLVDFFISLDAAYNATYSTHIDPNPIQNRRIPKLVFDKQSITLLDYFCSKKFTIDQNRLRNVLGRIIGHYTFIGGQGDVIDPCYLNLEFAKRLVHHNITTIDFFIELIKTKLNLLNTYLTNPNIRPYDSRKANIPHEKVTCEKLLESLNELKAIPKAAAPKDEAPRLMR